MGCGNSKQAANPADSNIFDDLAPQEDTNSDFWYSHLGDLLDLALQVDLDLGDSPVRLVDARFLIEMARTGARFRRRQDLPDAAFISLEQVKHMPSLSADEFDYHDALPIVSVSHAWLQPDHPDPHSFNLNKLAHFLNTLLQNTGRNLAVFLDFLSLFQRGPNGEQRNENEAKLFQKALSNMGIWYAHPHLATVKLIELPEGYPEGYTFPPGITPNTASYFDRGWCFCESSVGNFTGSLLVFNLGEGCLASQNGACWSSNGKAPLTPKIFRQMVAEKSFTSKRVDQEIVANLYEKDFNQFMVPAIVLEYPDMDWKAADCQDFAVTLQLIPNCQILNLSQNEIGDEGVRCLSEAFSKGALTHCKRLDLSRAQIGGEGIRCLSEALAKGALTNCEFLNLSFNSFGDEGMRFLSEALCKGALANCEALLLCGSNISDEGMHFFSEAIGKGALANCYEIVLSNNRIGDEGKRFLSEAIGKGALATTCHVLWW